MKGKLLKLIPPFLIGAGIALVILLINGTFTQTDTVIVIRNLCDAFAVSGVLIGCSGLMSLLSGQGAFDGLGYSFSNIKRFFLPSWQASIQEKETFADYKERKQRKGRVSVRPLFTAALFYLAVALAFLVVFNVIYVPA